MEILEKRILDDPIILLPGDGIKLLYTDSNKITTEILHHTITDKETIYKGAFIFKDCTLEFGNCIGGMLIEHIKEN